MLPPPSVLHRPVINRRRSGYFALYRTPSHVAETSSVPTASRAQSLPTRPAYTPIPPATVVPVAPANQSLGVEDRPPKAKIARSMSSNTLDEFFDADSQTHGTGYNSDEDAGATPEAAEAPQRAVSVLEQADALYAAKSYDVLLHLLTNEARTAPDQPELLWRLARVERFVSTTLKDKVRKRQLLSDGYTHAKRCIELDPSNAHGHKWCSITLSKMGEFDALSDRVKNAFLIRDYIVRAIELDPSEPYNHHILGEWCYAITDALGSWATRAAVSAFFAEPPKSSFEEALSHFFKAEKCRPGFWNQNQLRIAHCYEKLGDRASCKKWAASAAAMAVPEDAGEDITKAHEDAKKLMLKY